MEGGDQFPYVLYFHPVLPMMQTRLTAMDALNLTELGLIPLYRHPKHRKGSYNHIDQLEFYSKVERGAEGDILGEDNPEEPNIVNISGKDIDFSQSLWKHCVC